MKNTKIKLSKKAWIAILIISVAVLLICVFFIVKPYLWPDPNDEISRDDFLRDKSAQSDVTTPVEPATPDEPTEAVTEPPTEAPTINSFGYELEDAMNWEDVDFGKLNNINPDIYAWLYVPGTNVDYPVAQSMRDRDDSFYLSHNIYREYQFSGTIYSEVKNSIDFHDPVTLLYGHNMLNGSMFATLHYFSDEDFFNKHTTMFVQTKDKLYTYLIYAAYVYDDRHILNSFDFSNEEVRMNYFNYTLNPRTYSGFVREGVKLDKDSNILTLSTCTNGGGNTRYLVQGVLVDEQLRS